MANNIESTICRAAWDYPVLNLSNNEISMCCHSKHHKVTNEDIEALGTNLFTKYIPIKQAKTDLLNGVQNSNCSYCWDIESKGMKSSRSGLDGFTYYLADNNYFGTKDFKTIQDKLLNLSEEEKTNLAEKLDAPRNIEIALGNTCDLKCMYCNEFFSSQWAVEKIKYKELNKSFMPNEVSQHTTNKMEEVWWDWFENQVSDKVWIIGFIGGEPLIIDKLYDYVDRILKKYENSTLTHPIYISIVTNFNTPDAYFNKFLALVNKIARTPWITLDLSISLESLGDKTEFVRTGSKWERVEGNLNKLLTEINKLKAENIPYVENKIVVNVMAALNALCISDLPNFFNWVVNLQSTYNLPINIRGSQVVYPQWLSPGILPESYVDYIEQSITILENGKLDNSKYLFGYWTNYIEHLKEVAKGIQRTEKDIEARKSFVENINLLTSRRNLDFNKTFPEMIEFYEMCKTL